MKKTLAFLAALLAVVAVLYFFGGFKFVLVEAPAVTETVPNEFSSITQTYGSNIVNAKQAAKYCLNYPIKKVYSAKVDVYLRGGSGASDYPGINYAMDDAVIGSSGTIYVGTSTPRRVVELSLNPYVYGKKCFDIYGWEVHSLRQYTTITIDTGSLTIAYDPICEANETYDEAKAACVIPEKLHVREWTCPLPNGYHLVTESFAAGTINQYAFRYPVNYFCASQPVIITGVGGAEIATTAQPYRDIVAGRTVTVPAGQTYTFFYVIRSTVQLPIICVNATYDANLNKCVIEPGIIHACSQGQFDPSLGVCVVQPSSEYLCPEGGRYDAVQNVCIWNPPVQAVCLSGAIYDIDSQKCVYMPTVAAVCTAGYAYNAVTDMCERYPEKTIVCDPFFTYDLASDKCMRYPDLTIICPQGSFNSVTDKCEYTPIEEAVCSSGYTYNSVTKKCEYSPALTILCLVGSYDVAKDACVKTPPTQLVCDRGILSADRQYCIYTPDLAATCPVGNYDAARDACVVTPDIAYLCISGKWNGTICIIEPETKIICRTGFTYNKTIDKCVRYPEEVVRGVPVWVWIGAGVAIMAIAAAAVTLRRK